MGIWDGAESPVAYNGGSITASNWGTMFTIRRWVYSRL